jgi:hypothetical protein
MNSHEKITPQDQLRRLHASRRVWGSQGSAQSALLPSILKHMKTQKKNHRVSWVYPERIEKYEVAHHKDLQTFEGTLSTKLICLEAKRKNATH